MRSVHLVHIASHEWIGLAVYRALGKTDALLPGPKLVVGMLTGAVLTVCAYWAALSRLAASSEARKTCNSSEPWFLPAVHLGMDWVLGIISVFCFAAGLSTLALALGVAALMTNIGIIALRLRSQGHGGFLDHGWVAPKLFTALMLIAAVWLFATQAGYIG